MVVGITLRAHACCASILPFSYDLALFFTLHNPAEDCYV